ncbi:imidazole glycerol phosphate synthase subunit HisH [Streptomyces tanashiensis]
MVFDYGFGNVRSAERALARTGADVEITRDFDKAMNADGLLVPGIGAFAALHEGPEGGARRLDHVDRRLREGGRPVMGICVGMQILFARGIEHGVESEGLDEWPASSSRSKSRRRAPHGLEHRGRPGRLRAVRRPGAGTADYFVHSYAVHDWTLETANPAMRAPAGHLVRPTASRSLAAVENGALSAHPVPPPRSPATPVPSASPTGSEPCRHGQARTAPRRRRPATARPSA